MLHVFRNRRGTEPPSIFEHISAHVEPGVSGLTEGGDDLPDEEIFAAGGVHYAPGAYDGIGMENAYTGQNDAAIPQIHTALVALAQNPGRGTRARVGELFRQGNVWLRVHAVIERLGAYPPSDSQRLYTELRTMLLRSGYRDEVKFAGLLVSTYRHAADVDLYRVLGRHEEFTLYAGAALGYVAADPQGEWLALLPHVTGWGRTELSELLLLEPQPEEIRETLLRSGLGIGNELTLARGCQLHETLAREDIADDLVVNARIIMLSLIRSRDLDHTLIDYAHAGEACEALVARLVARDPDLDDFVALYEIEAVSFDPKPSAAEVAVVGLDVERRARLRAACSAVLDRDVWRPLAREAMASPERIDRRRGMEVARRLGVDLHDYLIVQIRADRYQGELWSRLVAGGDEARVRESVDLALSLWDLSDIALGPGMEHFGAVGTPLKPVDFLLQELHRFPGVGEPLLVASLQSPIVRHRFLALKALAAWDQLPPDVERLVRETARRDPHHGVRRAAAEMVS